MLFENVSDLMPEGDIAFRSGAKTATSSLGGDIQADIFERAASANSSRTKRAIDVIVSAVLIVFLAPALILIALAVVIDSRGPVIFRQQRYCRDKQVFQLLKFRTMTVTESTGTFDQATRGDTRITAVGSVLRRTSLDELLQLFNVLRGDMSLVGPRPHAVAMDDTYTRIIPGYAHRHLVRPGMTGLAQIRGYRGPTDSDDKIVCRIQCDCSYIARWSVSLDLKILLQTPWALLGPNAF